MSNLRLLPLVTFDAICGTNEYWSDTFAYLDAGGNALPGDGIALYLMARLSPTATRPEIVAVSDGSTMLNGVTVNGALTWGGTSGNVIGLNIPADTMGNVKPDLYVVEIQGVTGNFSRVIARINLTVVQGVVR